MKHRVAALVGPVAEKMWVSTFHSACVRILRRDAGRLGYPSSFTIYDQADALRLTGYVIRDLGLDAKRFPPRSVHATIWRPRTTASAPSSTASGPRRSSSARSPRSSPSTRPACARPAPWTSTTCWRTPSSCSARFPDVLEHYQRRFRHVLVDEYQDTNRVQNELVLLLGAEHRNVCVVGDSDQSIYQFRGADMRNILEFENAFPDVTVVLLEQNYRSTQTILDAANAVIANNLGRKPKELWTDQGAGRADRALPRRRRGRRGPVGRPPDRRTCTTTGHALGRHAPSSTAPTPRAGSSRSTSCACGIPYKVVGGTRFYDRREVKDALAYLKAVVNPADEVSVKRVLNTPKRGVGDSVGRPPRRLRRAATGSPSSTPCAEPATPGSPAGPSRASTRSSSCSTS